MLERNTNITQPLIVYRCANLEKKKELYRYTEFRNFILHNHEFVLVRHLRLPLFHAPLIKFPEMTKRKEKAKKGIGKRERGRGR